MTQADWTNSETRALEMMLLGKQLAERDDRGAPVEDDDLLLLLNAGEEAVEFALPGAGWQPLLDTAASGRAHSPDAANPYFLGPRSLALLVKAR